jgi:hypothetical protein
MQSGEEVTQFNYSNDTINPTEAVQANEVFEPISWQASEFIDHQKTFSWFALLALGALFLSVIIYLVTKSIFSSAVVIVAVLAFGVIAVQKPRQLTYSLLSSGIVVGDKKYIFDDFKTFSVNSESAVPSVSLIPIKKFIPVLTIYFSPEDGEKIFDILALYIPHEQRKDDAVERLMSRIRF